MRESGVILDLYSLPPRNSGGCLGDAAKDFLKFLSKAGQSFWQVSCPFAFEKRGAFASLFAGNYMLIDEYKLWEEGLIKEEDKLIKKDEETADLKKRKKEVIKKAYYNFFAQPNITGFYAFCEDNKKWLDGYALFMTLKEKSSSKPWYLWEKGLAFRQKEAIDAAAQEYEEEIEFYRFEQFLFYRQWKELLEEADKKGVKIIGEMPLKCPLDSADVWTNAELFDLRFLKKARGKEKVLEESYPSYDYKKENLIKWLRALLERAEGLFHFTYLTQVFDGSDKKVGKPRRSLSISETAVSKNAVLDYAPKNFLSQLFEGKGQERFILQGGCQNKLWGENFSLFCAKDFLDGFIEEKNGAILPSERVFLYFTQKTLERAKNLKEKDRVNIPQVFFKEGKTLADKLWTREADKVIIDMRLLLPFFEGKEGIKEDFSLWAKTLSTENALKLFELTREK